MCGPTASYACLNNILECAATESECSASAKCGTVADLSLASFTASASAAEGGSIVFTVELSRNVVFGDGEVSFTFTTSTPGGDGKAEAADIGAITTLPEAASGKIIIGTEKNKATITVPIKRDEDNNEGPESFDITIIPANFSAADNDLTATGMITAAPLTAEFIDPAPAAEGGAIKFTVQLNRNVVVADGEVSFTYSLDYGTSAGRQLQMILIQSPLRLL